MEQLIEWLELNYNLVIQKLKKNFKTYEELEAEVVIGRRILAPSTALELAEIFEEYLNTVAVLETYEVELPSDVKEELIRLTKEGLTKLIDLANAELNNNGNLALFINVVVNNVPFNIGMATFNKNMINISFNSHEKEVVGSV